MWSNSRRLATLIRAYFSWCGYLANCRDLLARKLYSAASYLDSSTAVPSPSWQFSSIRSCNLLKCEHYYQSGIRSLPAFPEFFLILVGGYRRLERASSDGADPVGLFQRPSLFPLGGGARASPTAARESSAGLGMSNPFDIAADARGLGNTAASGGVVAPETDSGTTEMRSQRLCELLFPAIEISRTSGLYSRFLRLGGQHTAPGILDFLGDRRRQRSEKRQNWLDRRFITLLWIL